MVSGLPWLPFLFSCDPAAEPPSSAPTEVSIVAADPALVEALALARPQEAPLVEAFIEVRNAAGESVTGAILASRRSAADPWVELGRSSSPSAVHFVPGGAEVTVLPLVSEPGSVKAMMISPEAGADVIRRQKMPFVVADPCALVISVTDAQGVAVTDARLELWRPLPAGSFGSSVISGSWEPLPVVTDEVGAQEFKVDCGETMLKVSPPEGPAAVFQGIVPGASAARLDLVLPETWVEVGGVVKDGQGVPVPGLTLDLAIKLNAVGLLAQDETPPHEIFTFQTATDSQGRYRFRVQSPDDETRTWSLSVRRGSDVEVVQDLRLRPGEPEVHDLVEPRGRWVTVGCQTAEGLESCRDLVTAGCQGFDGSTWAQARREAGPFDQRWCPVEESVFQFDLDAVRIPIEASATVLDLRGRTASVALSLPTDRGACLSTLRRPVTLNLLKGTLPAARMAVGRGGRVHFPNVAPGEWVVEARCGVEDGELSSLMQSDWSKELEVADQPIDLGEIALD